MPVRWSGSVPLIWSHKRVSFGHDLEVKSRLCNYKQPQGLQGPAALRRKKWCCCHNQVKELDPRMADNTYTVLHTNIFPLWVFQLLLVLPGGVSISVVRMCSSIILSNSLTGQIEKGSWLEAEIPTGILPHTWLLHACSIRYHRNACSQSQIRDASVWPSGKSVHTFTLASNNMAKPHQCQPTIIFPPHLHFKWRVPQWFTNWRNLIFLQSKQPSMTIYYRKSVAFFPCVSIFNKQTVVLKGKQEVSLPPFSFSCQAPTHICDLQNIPFGISLYYSSTIML